MLPKRKTFTAYDSDEDMLSTCSSDMDYDMEQETTSRPTHLMASAGAYTQPQKSLDLYCNIGNRGVVPINLIRAGTGFTQRIGRRVNIDGIILTGFNAPFNSYGTIMIVYDRQPNGALPNWIDIFNTYDYNGTLMNAGMVINPNNMSRFEILYRRTISIGSTVTGYFAPYIDNDYVCCDKEVQFQNESNPPVIGDISTGALYIVSSAALQGVTRIIFSDQ